ncbi:hypothetical protein Tco_1018288 [Tanacetum coccineum]|uniref:Uncharacterized protein n=1 Tax=Tanacetum coccineum TaxID=301880 RepID=A0ABQ5FTW9_9ASTR
MLTNSESTIVGSLSPLLTGTRIEIGAKRGNSDVYRSCFIEVQRKFKLSPGILEERAHKNESNGSDMDLIAAVPSTDTTPNPSRVQKKKTERPVEKKKRDQRDEMQRIEVLSDIASSGNQKDIRGFFKEKDTLIDITSFDMARGSKRRPYALELWFFQPQQYTSKMLQIVLNINSIQSKLK